MNLLGQRVAMLGALLLVLGGRASAQIIPIRTVPLAQGDQFLLFPSSNLGMGGVSIALSDSLFDPFRNPALGVRVDAAHLFVAPTAYSSSRETGGGRTLPIALIARAGAWFGGFAGAVQQIERSQPFSFSPPFAVALPRGGPVATQDVASDNRSHGNSYAFATLGKSLGVTGVSVGGSVQWSTLHALDGVDLLYPGSQGLSQSGHVLDLRLGLNKEWSGNRSLEILALHDRFAMTQDVSYIDVFWDPGLQQFVQAPRVERNRDRNRTTGLHVAYQRPLTSTGWRIGLIGTANIVSSPRIATNEIVTVPRDQGRATALNLGVGFSKTRGLALFGLDVVYEPIWSNSWAVADVPMVTVGGETIPAGGRTIVNRFRFSNVVLRLGVAQEMALTNLQKAVRLDLGLGVRSMHYRLTQEDRLAATEHPLRNSWVEWSPTWGLSLRFPDLELRYRGRVLNGTGRPSPSFNFGGPVPLDSFAPNNLVVNPGETINLAGVTTITHQISLSLPLR